MKENHTFNLSLLWDASNGGLSYFHEVYPESIGKENRSKHFKTHKETTASTTLSNKKSKDNKYILYNHATSEGFDAVAHYMKENSVEFPDACSFLFNKYGVATTVSEIFKPTKKWENDTDKENSYWKINPLKKTDNFQFFAPFLTSELCKEYDFVALESFETIKLVGEAKKPSLLTVNSTANYPIFAYKNKDFAKIYEPKAIKNEQGYSSKHHFLGTKPPRHIYGWERIFNKVDFNEIERLYLSLKVFNADKFKIKKEINALQFDAVIIATGGSDGLNIASLGYDVIWFNSEAEIISSDEYYKLSKVAKTIYYLPDLDKTGVKQAVAMGLQFLKIKMIWLPETLKIENKKDIADWVRGNRSNSIEKVQAKFKQLLSQALEFKFWEWSDKRGSYTLNNKIMLYFLKHNGFYLYRMITTTADSTNEIEETRMVQIKENIVSVVSARQVKNYVLNWLEINFIDVKVYNMILKSVYFSDNALLNLPEIELQTRTGTKSSQLYFFANKVVKITDKAIVEQKYFEVDNLVWKSNVIKHDFSIAKPFFEITKDESENWKIDILDNSSNYLKVLINTSRVFWQKEQDENHKDTNNFNITGTKLTSEENNLQMVHLINKMFCVGYAIHKYKQKSKPYFVLGIDGKIGASIKASNGGSGKSFIMEAVSCFLKNIKFKDGKEMPKEDPKFIFDGVTKETDLVFMDDMVQNQDYNVIFSKTSGVVIANHKGGKIHTIPFEDACKFVGTTNFVPNDISSSLKRRLLSYQCSDYYHEKSEEYFETRKISSDFQNKDLFDVDYSKENWNQDYNFMLQCLQFYLSQEEKISAPEENLVIRNLQQQIGDVQMEHCNSFFKDKTKLDVWFSRNEIQLDYNLEAGKYSKTPNAHKKGLELFCKMNGWEIKSEKKAVIDEITKVRKSVEHYFINTTNAVVPEMIEEEEQSLFDDDLIDPNEPF